MGDVGDAVEGGDLVAWFGGQQYAAWWSEECILELWLEKKIPGRFNSSRDKVFLYLCCQQQSPLLELLRPNVVIAWAGTLLEHQAAWATLMVAGAPLDVAAPLGVLP